MQLPRDESTQEMERFQELYLFPAISRTFHVDLMKFAPEERYGETFKVLSGENQRWREEAEEKKRTWSLGVPERKEDFVAWMNDETTGKPVPILQDKSAKQVPPPRGTHPIGTRKKDKFVEKEN